MATTLVIQTEMTPIAVEFPAIAAMSGDDFSAFCSANPDLRIERTAAGEVIVMSPASAETGYRNLGIGAQLWLWAEQDGSGLAFDSSAGFTLPNGAVRAPDAAWVKREKWEALTDTQQDSFAPLCPDFVIELKSSSDSLRGLQAKMQEYVNNGTTLGWLVDPERRTVCIYRPDRAPHMLDNPDCVCGDPELPGFEMLTAKIW